MFTQFLEIFGATNPASYDIDFVDGTMIGELARRRVGKQSNTLRLLRTIVTFVMSLPSTYSSQLFAAHRVIPSSTEHQI